MRHPLLTGLAALLLACNYLAFQVELFEDEYEQNHPVPSAGSGISSYSANWESFDKDNAPQAFYFDPILRLDCLLVFRSPNVFERPATPPFQPIRDKSPPCVASSIHYYSIT
jgi:hypothetical protein